MGLIAFLLQFFVSEAPRQFEQGVRVNLVRQGSIARGDGIVMAQTPQGVLVDWPKGGADWTAPRELVQQLGA